MVDAVNVTHHSILFDNDEICRFELENASIQRYFDPEKPGVPTRFQDIISTGEYLMEKTETAVCFVMCLQVKHSKQTGDYSMSFSRNSNSRDQGTGHYKRLKTSNKSSNWDRMYLFADLLDPGRCLVMMNTQTSASRSAFLKHPKQRTKTPIVGHIFAMLQPSPTQDLKKLGDMAMVTVEWPLVPLKRFTAEIASTLVIKSHIPHLISPGNQRYFVLHRCTSVRISNFKIEKQSTCAGYECDRAHSLLHGQVCGCLYLTSDITNYVGQFDLIFKSPFPITVHDSQLVQVKGFRSWRTTNMIFGDFTTFCNETYREETHVSKLKNRMNKLVRYVNENGGWTIIGWFRKGEVLETAESNDVDRNESPTVLSHISVLIPTDDAIDTKDPFKLLLLDNEDQPPAPTDGT